MNCLECGNPVHWYCSTCWGGNDSAAIVWVIDGNWVCRLLWHRSPEDADVSLREWCDHVKSHKPASVIVALDSAWSWRKHLSLEYKAQRKPSNDGFYEWLVKATSYMQTLGWRCCSLHGFEGDDLIASLVTQNPNRSVIVSGDQDLMQFLQTGKTSIYRKRKGGWQFITATQFEEQFGFPVERYLDYKLLVGDSSDNLTGCHKIGPKTAQRMLEDRSLDEIMQNVDDYPRSEELREFANRLPILRTLMTCVTHLPVIGDFDGKREHDSTDREPDSETGDQNHQWWYKHRDGGDRSES